MTYHGQIALFSSNCGCFSSLHLHVLKLQSCVIHVYSALVIALLWRPRREGEMSWTELRVCVNSMCMRNQTKPTFQPLFMCFYRSLCLLLDEPTPKLFPLSLLSAPTVWVLAHQAREHHLGVTLVCFPAAVWVIQVILPLAPRLLVLIAVVDNILLHRTFFLLLLAIEKAGYFAVLKHVSI